MPFAGLPDGAAVEYVISTFLSPPRVHAKSTRVAEFATFVTAVTPDGAVSALTVK